MLSAEGCRARRERLWQRLDPKPNTDYLVLSDPIHLVYLANCYVDPFHLGAWARPYLIVRRDGHAKLIHDNRAPKSVEQAHVDERRVVSWYDGQSPGQGPRQLAVLQSVNPNASGLQIHDRVGDPMAANVINTIADMRRQKDRDEIEALKACMRATEAGHAWARENAAAGMTELDVYNGIFAACCKHAGKPVIVYGDFAVCDGPARRGGMATNRVLQNGDMLILDFSVVIDGYRSDFTNTLVIGKQPNSKQQHLFDMCRLAMSAGENELRAGASCLNVYQAVHEVFRQTNLADHFPHHAGHGLGLSHPEAPYFVRHANETLRTGDVVTLEPGLYVEGVGGVRIEHNYLVTENGFERLSQHEISLV